MALSPTPLPGHLVLDQGHNHAVQVEEEHDKVETQLGERFPLMNIQLAEDLGSIQQVGVVDNPANCQ
jgi:hypothetical protein